MIFINFGRKYKIHQQIQISLVDTSETFITYYTTFQFLKIYYRGEDAAAQPPAFELPSAGAVWNSPVPPAPRPVRVYEDGSTIAIGRRKRATAKVRSSNSYF